MIDNTEITLAFLNYNTADELLQALDSVEKAIDGVVARVVVIDNGSTDDSVARIKSSGKEVEIIALPKNAGFAAAFNRIFSYVISPYYLLLNSDIILKPGCVKKMLAEFKNFPRAGLAGVALEREDGSVQNSYGIYPNLASELINRSLYHKLKCRGQRAEGRGQKMKKNRGPLPVARSQESAGNSPLIKGEEGGCSFPVDCVVGAVMLVSRETIDKVGGMDERFFFFLEETDWCKRINESGMKVIHLPEIKVVHLQGKSANKAPVRARIEFHKSRLMFFEKHYGKSVASILRIATAFRLIINLAAQLIMTVITLGLIKKTRLRTVLYAGLLGWYFCGCPAGRGLGKP